MLLRIHYLSRVIDVQGGETTTSTNDPKDAREGRDPPSLVFSDRIADLPVVMQRIVPGDVDTERECRRSSGN